MFKIEITFQIIDGIWRKLFRFKKFLIFRKQINFKIYIAFSMIFLNRNFKIYIVFSMIFLKQFKANIYSSLKKIVLSLLSKYTEKGSQQ